MRSRFVHTVLALAVLAASASSAPDCETLTVVYTANSNGKLMNCNCPHDNYGGLSERVTLMKELRGREDEMLLVDAGNMVDVYGDFELKASCVARMMNMMDYDAAAAGRNEIFRGLDRIKNGIGDADFPLLSATIAEKSTGNRAFQPYTVVTVGDVSVAVAALCDSTCFVPSDTREYDYIIHPWEREMAKILPALESSDFIVILSQMPADENRRLLKSYSSVDIVVEGYGNETYDEPIPAGNGFIVSPGYGGRFVGLVTLESDAGKVSISRSELIPVLDYPEDSRAHRIVVEYYRDRR